MPTADKTPKICHFDFYTDEFHHNPVDIPQNCLDVNRQSATTISVILSSFFEYRFITLM